MKARIQEIVSPEDPLVPAAWEAVSILRPHLTLQDYLDGVNDQMASGYRALVICDSDRVAAYAGFRVTHMLAWGRLLYIDDLVTHPDFREKGYGGHLLAWMIDEARRLGCPEVHLDSGHQRFDAHSLYHKMGFRITSHHFSMRVS